MSDINEKLQEIFRDIFDDKELEIQNSTSANDIDEWDSFSQINLLAAIEKKFNIHFSVAEIIDLKNVGEMVKLVEKKLQMARGSDV